MGLIDTQKTKDISKIAAKIAALPKKNSSLPRIAVITQGTDPTIVATGGDKPGILTFPVRPVKEDEIVDTNGAGYELFSFFFFKFFFHPLLSLLELVSDDWQ